jgi:hypothetical protein
VETTGGKNGGNKGGLYKRWKQRAAAKTEGTTAAATKTTIDLQPGYNYYGGYHGNETTIVHY